MIEAYRIGVSLSLINNVSAGLGLISRHFGTAQGHVTQYQKSLDKIKLTMLAGGAAMGVGFFGLSLIGKTIGPAKEYAHQLSQLNILGMKHSEIMGVVNKAWAVSRDVPTTTAADNLKAYRELRSAFGAGHEHEALGVLDKVQMVTGILSSIKGKEQEGVGFDMVKGIELTVKGALSEDVLQRRMGMMTQSIVGMGGTVDARDFHQALKYAKSGASSYSEDFIFKYLPTLIQEFKTGKHGGASSAGTSLNAGFRMVVGQQIAAATFQNWIDAGLIDTKRVVPNKHHTGVAKLLPGAVIGGDTYGENPEIWAQKYGLPGVKKLMEKFHLTQDQAINSLTKDGNKAFLLKTLINKAAQFDRDKLLVEKADGIKSYKTLMKTDPQLAEQALEKQWTNLKAIIGFQIMPQLIQGTLWLIDRLKSLTHWVRENEGTAKKLVYGFTALSGALAIGGAITMAVGFLKLFSHMLKATGVSKLIKFAWGIGRVGLVVGWVSGAIAAFGVGWTIGKVLNDTLIAGSKFGDWLGGVIAHLMAPFSSEAREAIKTNSGKEWYEFGPKVSAAPFGAVAAPGQPAPKPWLPFGALPPASSKAVQVNSTINIDGRKVAEVVTTHQSRAAARPQTGSGAFNTDMTPAQPGTTR